MPFAYFTTNGTVGDESHLEGAVVEMPDNQLADMKLIGFAREATEEEVEAARAPIAPEILKPAAPEHDPVGASAGTEDDEPAPLGA